MRCDILFYIIQGHLSTYRNCDNVWTLNLRDVEFHDSAGGASTANGGGGLDQTHLPRLKVVACEWQRSRQATGKSAAGGGSHSSGGGSHSRSSRAAPRNVRPEEPDDSEQLVAVEDSDIASLDEQRNWLIW